MTLEKFEQIKIRKGAFVYMEYCSYPKVPKSKGEAIVMKVTQGVFRLGVRYSKLKVNIGKQVQPLKGGTWKKDYENLLIESSAKEGQINLRVYTTNNHKHRAKTTYYLNGEEVSKQYLLDNGYIKDYQKDHLDLFLVNLENVIRIGKKED